MVSDVKYEYLSAKVSSSTSLMYAAIPTLFFIYYINIFCILVNIKFFRIGRSAKISVKFENEHSSQCLN